MTDTESTDDRTLHVYVGEEERLREQTKDMLRAVEAGDEPDDAGDEPDDAGHTLVLNFESEADLVRRRQFSIDHIELERSLERCKRPFNYQRVVGIYFL